jgi:hypothetical protein
MAGSLTRKSPSEVDTSTNAQPVPEEAIGNVPAPSELYRAIRSQMEHLNNTMAQRVIWLTIGQSFFFGAFATLVTAKEGSPEMAPVYHGLVNALPIAAMCSVVLTFIDVIASIVYLKGLRKTYEEAPKNAQVDDYYPLIHGAKGHRIFQHLSPVLLPVLFLATWIILIIARYQ